MKIRTLNLDDGGLPASIVAEMTDREAALIVRMIGKTSHVDRAEFQHDGGEVGSDIYDALDSTFNRFYDAGTSEVPR